jgi:hypothetical protein
VSYYVLTEDAQEAVALRVRLRLRDMEIQRLRAEAQTSMDQVVAQAGEIARLKERLAEATRYREAS